MTMTLSESRGVFANMFANIDAKVRASNETEPER